MSTEVDAVKRSDLKLSGIRFVDGLGRDLVLRGVNICAKTPIESTCSSDVYHLNLARYSFVNRPFPLEEADAHFARIKADGFSFVRLGVPWEAIEGAGPGIYDKDFLGYLRMLVEKCKRHELAVIIDAHQDCWSRWTGGDGAPLWTLEICGFDVSSFWHCKAAVSHSEAVRACGNEESTACGDSSSKVDPVTGPEPFYPPMVWPCNYLLFATSTMFTIFFAGDRFAPSLKAPNGDCSMQKFLQTCYFQAYHQVALALEGLDNVLGFEPMNEPSQGYVGSRWEVYGGKTPIGWKLSGWESCRAANGEEVEIGVWKGLMKFSHKERAGGGGRRVWKDGVRCIWKSEGVWGHTTGESPRTARSVKAPSSPGIKMQLLKSNYFDLAAGENFDELFLKPFWMGFSDAIRLAIPDCFIFTGACVDLCAPKIPVATADLRFSEFQVWAPHYYDGLTLMTQKFRSWIGFSLAKKIIPLAFGARSVRRGLVRDLTELRKGGVLVGPVMVGEIGVPWMGSIDSEKAMDRSLTAAEDAGLRGLAIWCYGGGSDLNDDGWNGENLGIYRNGSLRVTTAVRPYPFRTGGLLRQWGWDSQNGIFHAEFESHPDISVNESLFFIPEIHFPQFQVTLTDGSCSKNGSYLTHQPDINVRLHKITVKAIRA